MTRTLSLFLRLCLLLLCLGGVTACSSTDKDAAEASEEEAAFDDKTVEELYNQAMDELEARDYGSAIETFEEVERRFPYSPWATKAQVMAAFANYRKEEYDAAIAGLERFVKVHPGNKEAPYAYYLIALSYYEQISDTSRDQSLTRKALQALEEVRRRFPESDYARDARVKIDLVRDHLAGKEMEVGRFYLKRRDYVAAINRFKNVVEHFQTTTHVAEALHRLVEAYVSLGVMEEAKKYAAVLGHNYPGSKWYERSYKLVGGKSVKGLEQPAEAGEDEAGGVLHSIQSMFE